MEKWNSTNSEYEIRVVCLEIFFSLFSNLFLIVCEISEGADCDHDILTLHSLQEKAAFTKCFQTANNNY